MVGLWNNSVNPVIGILTARKKDGSIAGNGPLFMEIQKRLISLNGISFVFTLEGVHEEVIEGFSFNPEENSWKKITAPYPDLVYNRIPFRKAEIKGTEFFSSLKDKNIPFFNPGFIDKYELYDLFRSHPFLHSYIPATIPAVQKPILSSFLGKFRSIYLKPAQSARGNGIFKLEIDSHKQVHLKGLKKAELFLTFDHFWMKYEHELIEKNYLAQEEIKPSLYDGKRFDFRILAHAKYDHYIVTGVGIRQSQEQDLTTHIPTGGRLLPYELLQTEDHDQFIVTIVEHIGKALSAQYGFFGEFSIDAGISQSGQYYIFEVNSKPMSFDEDEIEARKIEHLCRLFLQLTGFKFD
ncbi:YheC/YheD family endospore coat-associated protein [Neobacillus vireti]|uniref:YheC/YheD family endospore coat-associated protein n=1 Tax=Neobacillus vireti TaxID=220686 RepID=UPI00300018E9